MEDTAIMNKHFKIFFTFIKSKVTNTARVKIPITPKVTNISENNVMQLCRRYDILNPHDTLAICKIASITDIRLPSVDTGFTMEVWKPMVETAQVESYEIQILINGKVVEEVKQKIIHF